MKPSTFIIIHKDRTKDRNSSRPMSILKGIGLTLTGLILAALIAIGIFFAIFTQSLPSPDLFQIHYSAKPEPTRFYARDGDTLLFTLAYDNFESHDLSICESDGEGCFPNTFLKAARVSRETAVKNGDKYTLAEEMVWDVYVDYLSETRYPDFAAELLTRQILQKYGEEQLTFWYFNNAWYGQMAFGLDAAARLYLDKSGDQLTDAESVLMSAVVSTPMLNPIDSKGALRDFYLSRVAELHNAGMFSDEEADALNNSNFIIFEPPHYAGNSEPDIIVRKAMNAVINLYGKEKVEHGGLKIITTEDTRMQNYLLCITSSENEAEDSACPFFSEEETGYAAEILKEAPVSAALIDVNSGQILAELEAVKGSEGRSYDNTLHSYPIGSTMNIFAALTAFSGGSSPSTLLWDLPSTADSVMESTMSDNEPYHGPIQLREALTDDLQRPLSEHLQFFGSGALRRTMTQFGLSVNASLSDMDLLTKGDSYTAEALAYGLIPFAASGEQSGSDTGGSMHPVSIIRIEDENGETTIPQPETRKSLIAENLAYLVHNVLLQETGSLSISDRPSAAKMGEVLNDSSSWISGYTTELALALRMEDPQTASAFVQDSTRVRESAEILWKSIMEYAHTDRPVSGWSVPDGISLVRICLPSGKLPTEACKETMTDVFLRGNEPYQYDEYYVRIPINRENRLLATRCTDPAKVINEVFLSLPAEAAAWAEENGIEALPTAYDPIREKAENEAIQIESPSAFQAFTADENIDIIVHLSFNQTAESMQVSIGSGMYPTQWSEICRGDSLENGQWLLCTLNTASYDPGLYTLRTAFTLPNQRYHSAETYFVIKNQ